tara:strand:- start:131 stop:523 length:393 start_codon:yes stop_codon:yes gene_type:complete
MVVACRHYLMNLKALKLLHEMVVSKEPSYKKLHRVYKVLEKGIVAADDPDVNDIFLSYLCAFLLERQKKFLQIYLQYLEKSDQVDNWRVYKRKSFVKRQRKYLKENNFEKIRVESHKIVRELFLENDLYW